MNRFLTAWYWIQSSLWFIPGLMMLSGFVLAGVFLSLDQAGSDGSLRSLHALHGIYSGGPEGARALLSAVAGSTITVAGVIFSITIVALSQASSQFGPRLLRNFMRDAGSQLAMGAFIGTFVYCLLVLRTIRSEGDRDYPFVPQLSISVGVALALVCIGFLVYFIHHVAGSIQVDDVIAKVVVEMRKAGGLHPLSAVGASWDPATPGNRLPEGVAGEWLSQRSGYLQSLDAAALFRLACRQDLVLELRYRPGDFVEKGAAVLRYWPPGRLSRSAAAALGRYFILGAHRTPLQDFGYGINLLVEIAVRALSPAINDPFTALMCVDRIEEVVMPLAGRGPACPCRGDVGGRLRIIDRPLAFADILRMALEPLRIFGSSNPILVGRILEFLARAARDCRVPGNLEALDRHAEDLAREGGGTSGPDRESVQRAYRAYLRAREEGGSAGRG